MPQIPAWMIRFHDRFGRRANWAIWTILMIIAGCFYAQKALEDRSAFVRWQHQVLQLFEGENIYNEMMFPNPPIMPISLYPLMALPPLAGAIGWFSLKVAMTVASILLCFRMVEEASWRIPPWAEGFVLLFSLRPILSDLHHGNINLLILFLIVTSIYSWRKGYDVVAGLLLALAITYKVTPALFVPYFLYKRSWRLVGWTMLGMGIFFLILPSLVLGIAFNAECLRMWWHRILSPYIEGGVISPMEINQSMVGVLTRLLTEGKVAAGRYALHHRVNLVAWDPKVVVYLIKALSIALVGLLAWLCRTRTTRRDDGRLFGEFALVVLTMLIVSERSWKHHFVTLLLPYTYLVYQMSLPRLSGRVRWLLSGAVALSVFLMATTSSEIGSIFVKQGHKVALDYGMFLWAAVVLYIATAWRVRSDRERSGPPDAFSQTPRQPHFAQRLVRKATT